MAGLMRTFDANPRLVQLLSVYTDVLQSHESSPSFVGIDIDDDTPDFDLSYVLCAPIEKLNTPTPRSTRRKKVAVYHQHRINPATDTFIVVQEAGDLEYQTELNKLVLEAAGLERRCHWLDVHLMMLQQSPPEAFSQRMATYADIWNNTPTVSRSDSGSEEETDDAAACRQLSDAIEDMSSLEAAARGYAAIIRALLRLSASECSISHWAPLKGKAVLLEALAEGFKARSTKACERLRRLESPSPNTWSHLRLHLRGIHEKAEYGVAAIVHKPVGDSVSDRVLVLISIMVVPQSAIASILGMNVFEFDSDTSRLRVSTDLYIYFAIAVPFTFLTMAAWYGSYWFSMRQRSKGYPI